MLLPDQLISIRKHTRFAIFPPHKHNYVELSYVVKGSFTQIIGGKEIRLCEGELIFLNQHIIHKIETTTEEDIIINFLVRPAFFDFLLSLGDTNNSIVQFLIKTMYSPRSIDGEYIYFKVSSKQEPRNIVESIIEELYESNFVTTIRSKLLVGLLIVELIKHLDCIETNSKRNLDINLNIEILSYIDNHYAEGSLIDISAKLGIPDYKLSRLVKKYFGCTFKQLMQQKKLYRAAELLLETNMSIQEIMETIGYVNITYFYKVFKEKYNVTPHKYRIHLNTKKLL